MRTTLSQDQTMSIITPDTYDEFDPARIVFEPAKQFTGPTGGKFHRIFIKYRYDDDVIDTLVVQTPILMTWGVSLGKAFDGSEGGGAPQMSLVSYNSARGPTDEETTYIEICGQILTAIKAHMNAEPTKEDLDKWDMASDVNAMKVFYVKMERGKPVKGYPPTVYAKLYYEKPKDGGEIVITSRISDAKTGEDLPQKPRLGAAQVYASLVFSNIFIGAKPSVQTRIGEVMVVRTHDRKRHLKVLVDDDESAAPPRPATRVAAEPAPRPASVPIKVLKQLKKIAQ